MYSVIVYHPDSEQNDYIPIKDLDSDVKVDLEQKLDKYLQQIADRYASFVNCTRVLIKEKGVTVTDLCAFLMNVRAFSLEEKKSVLLLEYGEELRKAKTIEDIFYILSKKYASFMDYEIFQLMLNEYGIDKCQDEKLNYPKHLEEYINKHKLSEFIHIQSQLQKHTDIDDSEKVILFMNIESTSPLNRIVDLKKSVCKILGLNISALRILNIEKGSIIVTFLITTQLADLIFTIDKKFSSKDIEEFQALSVTKLECNGKVFKFTQHETPGNNASGKQLNFFNQFLILPNIMQI